MPELSQYARSVTIDNDVYSQSFTVTSNSIERTSPSVPAAKTGALTTRTNNTDGTLTMDAGHGFATGNLIDLYWNGGSRRGVVCGTVATNSVPISGGAGDNLPVNNTPITAAIPTQITMAITGDDCEAIASYCPVSGNVVFRNGTTVLLAHQILPNLGGSRLWVLGEGITNPLAGVTVTNVVLSHGDSTQAQTMRAVIAH